MTLKQYILIRTELKFSIGKIMAHVGHNVLSAYYDDKRIFDSSDFLNWYYFHDQTKIVLDGETEEKIQKIVNAAEGMGIPTSFIEDVHIKKKIVAVIGPVNDEDAKKLGLKKLRLYK